MESEGIESKECLSPEKVAIQERNLESGSMNDELLKTRKSEKRRRIVPIISVEPNSTDEEDSYNDDNIVSSANEPIFKKDSPSIFMTWKVRVQNRRDVYGGMILVIFVALVYVCMVEIKSWAYFIIYSKDSSYTTNYFGLSVMIIGLVATLAGILGVSTGAISVFAWAADRNLQNRRRTLLGTTMCGFLIWSTLFCVLWYIPCFFYGIFGLGDYDDFPKSIQFDPLNFILFSVVSGCCGICVSINLCCGIVYWYYVITFKPKIVFGNETKKMILDRESQEEKDEDGYQRTNGFVM